MSRSPGAACSSRPPLPPEVWDIVLSFARLPDSEARSPSAGALRSLLSRCEGRGFRRTIRLTGLERDIGWERRRDGALVPCSDGFHNVRALGQDKGLYCGREPSA